MALDFFAGCVGGCAGVAVGYPLDTVKVRIQTQDPKNPTYRGTYHCLQTIIQQESVRGLFKGMSSPMASVACINAMIFGVYGNVQRRLSDPNSLYSHAFAGAMAGFVQSFICSPMELVKTRIQIQEQLCPNGTRLYKGPLDCARQIWKAEGIRGIFRGLNITIAREIPAFGLYFSSYEAMTRRQDATKPLSTIHMMAAGGCAGICSWLFTYPIDFLKSRLQVDGLAGIRVYSGIWNCVMKTYQDEGARGFFRGMSSTLIRSFPVNAVTFSVVTWILEWSQNRVHSSESNVTYQDGSSLIQESLVVQDQQPVSRPHHQHETIFVAEWQRFDFGVWHLGLAGAAIGVFPVRNYAIHCRCSDWINSALAMTSVGNFHHMPSSSSNGSNIRASFVDTANTNPPPPLTDPCDCRESEEAKTRRQQVNLIGCANSSNCLLSDNIPSTVCPICKNPPSGSRVLPA